jgi:capsular polysaccharide biosynthesis protein
VIVKSLISPPVLAPPPLGQEAINPETDIPPAQLPAWSIGSFPPKRLNIHMIEDAWLFPRGLVLAGDGKVVACTAPLHTPEEIASAENQYRSAECAAQIPGDNILAIRPGLTNYGHFLIEILPAVPLVKRAFPQTRFTVLCGNVRSKMKQIHLEALRAIRHRSTDVTFVEASLVRVERLFIVEGLSVTARYTSPFVSKTIDLILSNRRVARAPRPRSIFVPRNPPMSRSIANRSEVDSLMEALGFTTVSPERYSFSEQVEMFAGADEVIGVIGAALTNTVFCRPGTRIITLTPVSMYDTFYWRVACLRSLKFYEIRCAGDSAVEADRPWNRPIIVPLDKMRVAITSFLLESEERLRSAVQTR